MFMVVYILGILSSVTLAIQYSNPKLLVVTGLCLFALVTTVSFNKSIKHDNK